MAAVTCWVSGCPAAAGPSGACPPHRAQELRAALDELEADIAVADYARRCALPEHVRARVDALEAVHATVAPTAFLADDPTVPDDLVELNARLHAEWTARQEEIAARGWIAPASGPAPLRPPEPERWTSRDGTRYGLAVLERAVDEIRTATEGTRNETVARLAYAVGGYVAGSEIDEEHAARELRAAARAVGGRDRAQMEDTARRAMRAGMLAPRQAPEAPSRRRGAIRRPRTVRRAA